MAAKKRRKKSIAFLILKGLAFLTWEIIKLPYYFVLAANWLAKRINHSIEKRQVMQRRKGMQADFSQFKVIQTKKGDFASWEDKITTSESTIGIVLGGRGSGKTAFSVKLLENIYAKMGKKIFVMGFGQAEMPSWVTAVGSTTQIQNNSFVLIDEGGILFSSRSSMAAPNKLLSQLLLISRHKNISILFITQNSSNLEVNVLRQADYLVLKPSSLLQKEFERKIIQKIYDENKDGFEKFKQVRGLTYIHSSEFEGFISNPLPTFWSSSLSKGFR